MNTQQDLQLQKRMAELERQLANNLIELENKNRDLEIESSLEQVRTVAMAMRKPGDMLEICKTISDQLSLLNVKEVRNVQTAIFNEQKGTYLNHEYYAKHNKLFTTEVYYKDHPVAETFGKQMTSGINQVWVREF